MSETPPSSDDQAASFSASNWRGWMVHSRMARRLGAGIVAAAGVGVVLTAFVIVAALVRNRPLGGASFLLLPGVPLLALGQLWAIGWVTIRQPPRAGSWCSRVVTPTGGRSPRVFFFGTLGARASRVLLTTAFLGWLSAMTAFSAIAHGGPAAAGGGCRYRLHNHGAYTCASESTYNHAGAGEQRFAAGILLAFFSIHVGAALGGRKQQDQLPAAP